MLPSNGQIRSYSIPLIQEELIKSLQSSPNLPTFQSLDYYIRFTSNSTHIHILLKFMNIFSCLQLLLSYDYIMHLVVLWSLFLDSQNTLLITHFFLFFNVEHQEKIQPCRKKKGQAFGSCKYLKTHKYIRQHFETRLESKFISKNDLVSPPFLSSSFPCFLPTFLKFGICS